MSFNEHEKNDTTDGGPEKKGLPTKEKAWEEVMKRVEETDNGMEKGWKEDVDTLLVFAGLFSAVVTAFVVESYQWLSEDPSEQSVAILAQISAQLNDRNATSFEPPEFTPSPSLVRINAFWFLSLILSLVDALFGLMCKQWLRELRRAANTQTPEQWLSMRCFKSESFERWHVPSILAALPIILEVALFCFLAGLLELLYTRHCIPFIIAAVVVGFAVVFYVTTTLLPGIDIIRLAFRIHPDYHVMSQYTTWTTANLPEMHYLCPYKSPQAWATFKFLAWILGPSFPFSRQIISYFLKNRFYRNKGAVPGTCVRLLSSKLQRFGNWFWVDLDIIERFPGTATCPNMYGLQAYGWLTSEFRDSPSMLPHLKSLLHALPPHLVMPTVFDLHIVRLDREWSVKDVEDALDGGRIRGTSTTPLGSWTRQHTQLLSFHSLWAENGRPSDINEFYPPPFPWSDGHLLSSRECCAPLTRIFSLIRQNDSRCMSLAFQAIENFLQYRRDDRLDSHDAATFEFESISPLLSSLAAVDLSSPEIKGPLVDLLVSVNDMSIQVSRKDPYVWIDTLDQFRVGQHLPKDYFRRHSGRFPVSVDRLDTLLCDSTTNALALEYMEEYCTVLRTENWFSTLIDLVQHLTSYVLRNTPNDLNRYPPSLHEELTHLRKPIRTLTHEMPYLLTSQEGLSFLQSLNTILKARFSGSRRLDNKKFRPWEVLLVCVAHLNRLPLDYFDSPNLTLTSPPIDSNAARGGNQLTRDRTEKQATLAGSSTSAEDSKRMRGLEVMSRLEWAYHPRRRIRRLRAIEV
ncbi:hypothetical protein PQX77_005534 [Marasmius sp. AFHP31]|nr:hypothetical protein PQX77_005534 [Marasmius sp. AFHP31]